MKVQDAGTKIPLQIGSEFRITKAGELTVDNPEIELADQSQAADAVLLYRFDPATGEHVIRLLDPVANHRHLANHQPGD